MKPSIRTVLSAAATLAIGAAVPQVPVSTAAPSSAVLQRQSEKGQSGKESFDEMYERGQKQNASIKTITAHFVETTTSSLLTTPIVSHGRLAVERPSRVVLQYEAPDAHVVLIDGNRMTVAYPARNIRQVTDIGAAQERIQKYFVNSSAAELRKQFDVQEPAANERPGTHRVTLVPKRKQIREALSQLDVWVDRSTSLLSAMQMTFANGDTKLITLDGVVPNAALEPGTFSATP